MQEPISVELDKMIRGTGGKLTQKAIITYQLEESLKAFLSNQQIQDKVSY